MDTSPAPLDLLSPEEAAPLLGLSPNALKLMRARGDGPPFFRLTHRTIRYSREAVLSWLAGKQEEPTQ